LFRKKYDRIKREGEKMLVKNLINHFQIEKNRSPLHVNELLDYIQKRYITGELCIVEYKKLFAELAKRNAEKPTSYYIDTKMNKQLFA
jgi:YppF-like protein